MGRDRVAPSEGKLMIESNRGEAGHVCGSVQGGMITLKNSVPEVLECATVLVCCELCQFGQVYSQEGQRRTLLIINSQESSFSSKENAQSLNRMEVSSGKSTPQPSYANKTLKHGTRTIVERIGTKQE